jgi:hypothetical protein
MKRKIDFSHEVIIIPLLDLFITYVKYKAIHHTHVSSYIYKLKNAEEDLNSASNDLFNQTLLFNSLINIIVFYLFI